MSHELDKKMNVSANSENASSDENSNKAIMLSFVSETVGLSPEELSNLKKHADNLADDVTLPEFLGYLQSANLEADILEKLKVFGRE